MDSVQTNDTIRYEMLFLCSRNITTTVVLLHYTSGNLLDCLCHAHASTGVHASNSIATDLVLALTLVLAADQQTSHTALGTDWPQTATTYFAVSLHRGSKNDKTLNCCS